MAIFLLVAGIVWLPFERQDEIYANRGGEMTPAGEITRGFHLQQDITPPSRWQPSADASDKQRACFGILFATYARTNQATFSVRWSQQEHRQEWQVHAQGMSDNAYLHFCPDGSFHAGRPFTVTIDGLDGTIGNSPTLWLTRDIDMGEAVSASPDIPVNRAMKISVSRIESVDARAMWSAGHGAFLLGWLCTLLVGILALSYPRGNASP